MENSKSTFQSLVAKMEALKENEQGKLKGGITVLADGDVGTEPTTNTAICSCTINVPCNQKPTINK